MSEVADILRKAADLIEPKGAWARANSACGRDGFPVSCFSESATSWCVVGAITKIAGGSNSGSQRAMRALRQLVNPPGYCLVDWNDREATHAEVVAALRAAADKAEQVKP